MKKLLGIVIVCLFFAGCASTGTSEQWENDEISLEELELDIDNEQYEWLAEPETQRQTTSSSSSSSSRKCRQASAGVNAYKGFVGGLNALFAIVRGDNPVEKGAWGYDAAGKQSIPRAIEEGCRE